MSLPISQNTFSIVTARALAAAIALLFPVSQAVGQPGGKVEGTVTRADSHLPVAGVAVVVSGTGLGTSTNSDGRYSIRGIPAGQHELLFRWIGFAPDSQKVSVTAGQSERIDFSLTPVAVRLSEVIVETASRVPERIVKAPAAITVVPRYQASAAAPTNQVAAVLRAAPGFDVVQSGMNDFNINARGFNSALNRRVLVLQDGRDLSFALLGAQEWPAIAGSLDELGKIEVVRGPGSALYGPNAFNGVVNITTPAARDVVGAKWNVTSGQLNTMRSDFRYAQLFANSRFAYKITGGYNRSDTYSRSRTRLDSSDIVTEYSAATDDSIPKLRGEARPLRGQIVDPVTGAALGERDPIRSAYGVGRLDYYSPNGSVATAEAGLSQAENEIFVTTIGRAQVHRSLRPYARLNWGGDDYFIMGYYSGRRTPNPQIALASGAPLLEFSHTAHLEGQFNRRFNADRGRIIAGASARSQHLDTRETLLWPNDDNRADRLYSGFGQFEYELSDRIKTVLGSRVDDGNLYGAQFSPKAAIVYSPTGVHSFRLTVNRAFQPPNPPEHFLHVVAGAPSASPQAFEKGVEAYFAAVRNALIAAGAQAQVDALNLPLNLPYEFPALTPVLALGNKDLKPQTVTGYELGYRGELSRRGYFTADIYLNQKRNFVTALLPGVNPNYPMLFTANGINLLKNFDDITALVNSLSIPAANKTALLASQPALKKGYSGLVNLSSMLPDGSRALVLSYANAGRVEERGLELASGFNLTQSLRVDAAYTRFSFAIKRATLTGDQLVPNTPKNKATFALAYTGNGRIDAGLTARFSQSYPWLAGVFSGTIPAAQILNANAGYQVNNNLKAQFIVTNIFDQKRFEIYGGSVNGRRALAGLTASF